MQISLRLITAVVVVTIVAAGCAGTKVMVPPRVDLQQFPVIALVQFSSNAEGNLDEFASQKFIEMLQASQPGVGVLELSDQETVLAAIDHAQMDHKAIRAISEEYGVDAIVVGNLDVSDVKPSVDVSASLLSGSVRAEVDVSLSVRLYDGASGATIWTNSCARKESVAHVGLSSGGGVSFGAGDPEDAYGRLVNGLIYDVTDDFRVHYVRQ